MSTSAHINMDTSTSPPSPLSTQAHSSPHAGKSSSPQPRSPAAAIIIAAATASREDELHRTPAPDRGRGHPPPLNTPSLFRGGKTSSRRRAVF